MTEAEWLLSDDPRAMLTALWTRKGKHGMRTSNPTDRQLRLFMVGSCRTRWATLTTAERTVLAAVEQFVDGEISAQQLNDVRLVQQQRRHDGENTPAVPNSLNTPHWYPAFLPAVPNSLLVQAADILTEGWGGEHAPLYNDESAPDRKVMASLLRCVRGNPYRPRRHLANFAEPPTGRRVSALPYGNTILVDKSLLEWRERTIEMLARDVYDSRDFDRLPIMADALEEAGLTDDDIFQHLRGYERCGDCLERPGLQRLYPRDQLPGSGPVYGTCWNCESRSDWYAFKEGFKAGDPPMIGSGWRKTTIHCRGCWVVDLFLGKEL
jgi:hypothetical protein